MKNRGISACGAYIPALRMCRKSMAQAHSWPIPALRALARVSWKSHQNGARNPKAHRCKPVGMDTILNAPIIAEPLGLFDYCGVSDGAIADRSSLEKMVKTAVDQWGRVDGLVNNAGILRDKIFHKMSEEEWDQSLLVTLKGSMVPLDRSINVFTWDPV